MQKTDHWDDINWSMGFEIVILMTCTLWRCVGTWKSMLSPLRKFGIFCKPYSFGFIWKWGVLHCIPLQSTVFLLYNGTLFVTLASSRAEILPLQGGGVGK